MATLEIERSLSPLTIDDLKELYSGSMNRLNEYFINGNGKKWQRYYEINNPLAVALCQGAAMHYHDKINGIKDFGSLNNLVELRDKAVDCSI